MGLLRRIVQRFTGAPEPVHPRASENFLEPGSPAPDFDLDSHLDRRIHLSELLAERHALLIFYPLDFTPT